MSFSLIAECARALFMLSPLKLKESIYGWLTISFYQVNKPLVFELVENYN